MQADLTNGWALTNYTVANPTAAIAIKIDANNDNEISLYEATQVWQLDCFLSNATNFSGLEYFTNLRFFRFGNDNVTTFNFPTLLNLEVLGVYNNSLQNITLSNYPNLIHFNLQNTLVTNLNLTVLTQLKTFTSKNNPLTYINFGGNTQLVSVNIYNNPNLISINVRNSTINTFAQISGIMNCWTNNPNLN